MSKEDSWEEQLASWSKIKFVKDKTRDVSILFSLLVENQDFLSQNQKQYAGQLLKSYKGKGLSDKQLFTVISMTNNLLVQKWIT